LANRILTFAPELIDAAILDGVCGASICRLESYDRNVNVVGGTFLNLCATSPFCQNQLGFDPINTAQNLFYQIDQGKHVVAGQLMLSGTLPCLVYLNVTHSLLSFNLFKLLYSSAARPIVYPTIQKLLRCNAQDVKELTYYLFPQRDEEIQHNAKVGQKKSPGPSRVLQYNIVLSELLVPTNTTPASFAELESVTST
jgi:hypothetical protein